MTKFTERERRLIVLLIKQYDRECAMSEMLTKAFGGDTTVGIETLAASEVFNAIGIGSEDISYEAVFNTQSEVPYKYRIDAIESLVDSDFSTADVILERGYK